MWSALRNAVSRQLEALLRWLTASVIRSTAIFVILTFVPILLLTYYIVSTSIASAKATAAAADQQVLSFGESLLRADFQAGRETLAGAADEGSLQHALASAGQTTMSAQRDRAAATASLTRLLRRRPDFLGFGLFDAAGTLVAQSPATPAITIASPGQPLPSWFSGAVSGQTTASAELAAGSLLPPRLAFATAVGYPPPLRLGAASPGNANGVLVGMLPVSVVSDWVRHVGVSPDQFLYLVDANRQVLSLPAAGPFTAPEVSALPATHAALTGRSGAVEYSTTIQLESHDITYAPLPDMQMALLVVRPVRFGFYLFRVFYDKLALIAVIIFVLAVATGLLLRQAFRFYQRYNREVETGRAKTEALLGSIGDGVFAVDAEGRIIEFNRAAAALTGTGIQAALRRPCRDVVRFRGEDDAVPDPVGQTMSGGRAIRFLRNLSLLRQDGSRLPVTLSAAPVLDENEGVQGCIVVFSDASEEREVDRMKNEFISIASHQLRTPMSGVKGVLALLLEEVLGPLNPEQMKYVRRAYDSNERLIALVNDLLNISRLEQGRLALRAEPVNLAELLAGLVADYQSRAGRYQQRLEFSPAPEAGNLAIVTGDPMRLREVFSNLIDNAVKYTPEHGHIRVRLFAGPEAAVVEVSDSGVGIPADQLPQLFQKFQRIQNPLSSREFGSGLGLYFARSVIELHHGAIEVESRPGEGSTFRVRLPRQPAAATSLPAAALISRS